MRRALLVAVVCLLAGAGSAEGSPPGPDTASERPVNDARVFPNLIRAERYWQAVPDCPSGLSVWRVPDSLGALGWGAGCEVWLSEEALLRMPQMNYGAYRRLVRAYRRKQDASLCVLVAHEYGHLLGKVHVADRHAVMYGGRLDPRAVPACGALLGWQPKHY